MRSFPLGPRTIIRTLLLLPLVLVMLVGCGEAKVATEQDAAPQIAPKASNKLPQGIEAATLEIHGGTLDASRLRIQQDEPTTLHIVNGDNTAYRLKIENLVMATAIPANATTDVSFTTPKAGTYTGQLLGENNDSVVSEFQVTVMAPGGV